MRKQPPPSPDDYLRERGISESEPLPFLDIGAWEGQPVPPREWAVLNRIPRRNVALFSGEGGIGKSILIMQLAGAHVLGRDWLGTMPEPGPFVYVNAEDEGRELHYRLAAIADHYQARFSELKEHLHILELAGQDAILGAVDRSGLIRPTPLFERLLKTIAKLQPAGIALDTAADVFAGNENDRSQTRQFIGLLRRLAIAGNAGLTLLSHPSVAGIKDDTGTSGSTGWHNSVRSRLWLKAATAADGKTAIADLRELTIKKNNYGPSGEIVRLRWDGGVFKPVAEPSSMERAASEQQDEQLFCDLLDRFSRQDQPVSPKASSPSNYAPKVFAEHPAANGTGSEAFKAAMQRLLDSGTIKIETVGPPSRARSRLVRT